MRRILYLEWNNYAGKYMKEAFEKEGFLLVCKEFTNGEASKVNNYELIARRLLQWIEEIHPDFCFSFNFFPPVAIACQAMNLPYVSWTYDSPYIQLYSETINYPTNCTFVFDSFVVNELNMKGVKNCYYLPMAAPTESKYELSQCEGKMKENYQVSFVGNLYRDVKNDLFRHFDTLEPEVLGYLQGIMDAQEQVYGTFFIEQLLNEQMVAKLQEVAPLHNLGGDLLSLASVYSRYFLARKITFNERSKVLTELSEEFEVSYFGEKGTGLDIIECGKIDYYTEAPYVFSHSDINLNISLRSIVHGIPLRAMDIMGAGGFLLTNYQQDFMYHFIPEEDFVYFDSIVDLKQKVLYYTTHEEERKRIAGQGYKKVSEKHTYRHRVREMLDYLGG